MQMLVLPLPSRILVLLLTPPVAASTQLLLTPLLLLLLYVHCAAAPAAAIWVYVFLDLLVIDFFWLFVTCLALFLFTVLCGTCFLVFLVVG